MDENAPVLAKRLRTLKPEVRRSILAKACVFSAGHMGEVDPAVAVLLKAVQSEGQLSPEQVATALSLADAAKKRSFQLEEEDAPRHVWLKPFSEARLLIALATVFDPPADQDEASAIYELLTSQEHGSVLGDFLEGEIAAAASV